MSPTGTKRLVRRAIQYALDFNRPSVTLVHKGNVMKFTEGAFRDWGYELAREEFRGEIVTERETWILENREKNPSISAEENARLIEPGFDQMCDKQRAARRRRDRTDHRVDLGHARRRRVEKEAA